MSPSLLMPTKAPDAEEPPAADYMAVFEVTIAQKWADADRDGNSLLTRLEERLFISLACANALRAEGTFELGILDVIAVVGVVGAYNCRKKISAVWAASKSEGSTVRPAASSLLWQVMDAGRFVFVRQKWGDSSVRSSQ